MEYIATQGPLESTCVHFWKMVMQENVELIVMLAQFVENGKEKVHKYFPNVHESVEIDGITVTTMNECFFEYYCMRTIRLQTEEVKMTLTHLQYLDWPDHGCPEGKKII